MIGGLQGEFGDLDIKYLKQNVSKNVDRKYREASGEFRSKKDTISQPKADFAVVRNLPSSWSDRLPMVVTPSFQLRIAHRLKHWIADFPSFKTTYSMHKLSSRKSSKSG